MLCLNISRDLLFHVDSIGTPNEVWLNLESLFGKTDEMRGHRLENELISLSPTHYETIQGCLQNLGETFANFLL